MAAPQARTREIAPGVYQLETGRGITEANVYLVRSGQAWVLVDTAWPRCGPLIRKAAETLFGAGARPAAIVLTHIHPDHSGSALELARLWHVPVYVHHDELPLAAGGYLPDYANPLDRWLVAPLLRLMPRPAIQASRSRTSLAGTVQPLGPGTEVPGLPDWRCIAVPGHTPGHVAFFRAADRVLITGDSVLNVNLNSLRDLLARQHRVSGPPYISTWNWQAATESVASLARLRPATLAPGHGQPMTGPATAEHLACLAVHLARAPASDGTATRRPARRGNILQLRHPDPGRLRWTATDAERTMPLPGDELVSRPDLATTHAVTISAPPPLVWPWLVQTGQGRAGFYSDSPWWDRCVDWYYRLLSREQPGRAATRYQIRASDRIVAAWQDPQPGDTIADGPPGTACYQFRQVDPGRAFVLFTDSHLRYLVPARLREDPRLGIFGEISDSFLLTEPMPGQTRIIRRMRLRCGPLPFRIIALPIVLIWGEAITARNLLRGIKRRAEASCQPTGPPAR